MRFSFVVFECHGRHATPVSLVGSLVLVLALLHLGGNLVVLREGLLENLFGRGSS